MATLTWVSCNRELEGIITANQAPETHTVADTIIRFGENRLESEVDLLSLIHISEPTRPY